MEPAPTPPAVVALLSLWMTAYVVNFFVPVSCIYVDLVKTVEVRYKHQGGIEGGGGGGGGEGERAPLSATSAIPSDTPVTFTTLRVHRKIWNPHTLLGASLGFFMAWGAIFATMTTLYATLSDFPADDKDKVNAFAATWVPLSAVMAVLTVVITHHKYRFTKVMSIIYVMTVVVLLFAHRTERGSKTTTFHDAALILNIFTMAAAVFVVAVFLQFVPSLNGPVASGLGFGSMIGWAADGWPLSLWGTLDDHVIALGCAAGITIVTWVYEQCIFKRVARAMAHWTTSRLWNTFWVDVAAHNSG